MGAYIGGDGPRNARLVIVGEKPGREEHLKLQQTGIGRPFVGSSGHELDGLLTKIGTHRNNVYVTNAVKNLQHLNNPSRDEIEAERFDLYKELTSLPNACCIVPMGNIALQALSNFHLGMSKEVSKKEVGTGIKKYRGSILPTFFGRKMVPTYHPSYYMRGEWRFKPIVKLDLARALEESYDPTIHVPNRRCYIAQTKDDITAIGDIFRGAKEISFDIELLLGRYIQCIAFAKDPSEAYCIPITNGRRKSLFNSEVECYAWRVIQGILNQENTCYITQNGLFDCWHLWRHGITTPYMSSGFDTMLAHRLRAPDLPHDLGFLVSLYTREPYYKDESGSWKEQVRTTNDEEFWAYNCKDAACTLEVAHELMIDLERNNMLDYFKKEIQAQWDCTVDMRQRGLKVDPIAAKEAREFIANDIQKDISLISTSVGWIPNTKSNKDMEKLYAQLQIKLTDADRTKTGKAKIDVERLYSHAASNPNHRNILYAIAGLNQKRTLQSGFTNFPLDSRGYYHPSLDISKAKTGRYASEGADEGGPQIQNIPRRMRSIFIADSEESELTNADLAGAETWLQAFLAQDPLLMAALTKGIKVHNVRGCIIFRNWNKDELPPPDMLKGIRKVCNTCSAIGESECNHSEYYMAKQSGHAMGYREGPRRFCHEQRKKGIFISESDAKFYRQKIISKALAAWHLGVENSLRRSSWLETPLGRKRQFFGQLDDRLINAALSWLCQATVGQITNRAMLYLHRAYQLMESRPRLLTNTHDSLLTTHEKLDRSSVINLYKKAFDQSITIYNRTFTIPIEISHGPNWRDLK